MLVDSMLFTERSEAFGRQLLCVSAILLVVKLERDYNENLADFFSFNANQLKIHPADIKKCEGFILENIPADFGLLVGFSEVLKSLLSIMELSSVSQVEYELLSNKVIEAYIKAESKLSIDDLLVAILLKTYHPKKGAESKRKKLLAQLHHYRDKEKRPRSAVDANCKTVRVQAGEVAGS
jgi:hypothetical protein